MHVACKGKMNYRRAWFGMRKGEIEAPLSQADLCKNLPSASVGSPSRIDIAAMCVSNIEYLASKGCDVLLHRELNLRDSDIFKREAHPLQMPS